MDVFYTDGTHDGINQAKAITAVGQYVVYSIPVGFNALGLPAREAATGKTVHSYQVWISNEINERLSEVRTYYVNRDFEPNVCYLLYANSLGGYDTLRCTGQSSRTLTVRGTAAQRALDPNYLPTSAELFSLNRLGERVLTVNTGLTDGDQLDYLSELTLTDEIYVATQDGFVALTPTETILPLSTDDEDLAGRTLSFRYAKNEIGFSNLPAAPTAPARAVKWVPVNPFCLINERGVRTGMMQAAKLELRYADDGSLVKPRRVKANTPGTEGYTPPVTSPVCSTTPFANALIEQSGSFKRDNCGGDQEGTVATLTIPAGTYGGETAEQLNARISQALAVMDTQAYANEFGACLLNPALYSYSGPAGTWHYRANDTGRLAVYYGQDPIMGNSWNVQGQAGSYIFPQHQNNLDFLPGSVMSAWLVFVYGGPLAQVRIRVWVNGSVVLDRTTVLNNEGFELVYLLGPDYNSLRTLVSGDRVYVQLTDL